MNRIFLPVKDPGSETDLFCNEWHKRGIPVLRSIFFEPTKKFNFVASFLRKRLTHCNLQILYACNFQCAICDFWKKSDTDKDVLSLENVRIIAEKLRAIGPQVISIGGGEPLLHPDLLEITRTLARNNFPVMISNGWFMTRELAGSLWEAGCYEISVSLDYTEPELHDRQRGKIGAYTRAVKALKDLHATRVHPHQRVNMISVLMDDNLDQIEGLIQLSAKMGITYLLTLYSHGRGNKQTKTMPADAGRRLMRLKKKYNHFVVLRDYLRRFEDAGNNPGGVTPCYAGRNLFNIDSQGNVTLCIDTLDDPVGNILRDDMTAIQAGLLARQRTNTCGACWTSCRGPVETLMYGKNKLPNLLDYYHMTRDIPLGGAF